MIYYSFGQFIEDALMHKYRGYTIVDYKGDLFCVCAVSVSADMDGLQVEMRDRDHNGKTIDYPYDAPLWEPRSAHFGCEDPLPSIINLKWDLATKCWVPAPSEVENELRKRAEAAERDRLSNEAAAQIREGQK